MADFRDLIVWQRACRLALTCYRVTKEFPAQERYGLTTQIWRAAVSVSANLAEGSGRGSDKDFARFVRIAGGSANELESLLLIAKGLGYLSPEVHKDLHRSTREVRRMLHGLGTSLQV